MKINQKKWIKKLKEEGFTDIKVCPLPHTRTKKSITMITIKTYLPGDRVEVPAGTIHLAKGSLGGGEMIVGVKK